MTTPSRGHRGDGIDRDLVRYVFVVVPDLDSLATVAAAFADLVEAQAIRILDLVVVTKGDDASVTILELEDVPSLARLTEVEGEVGGLLSDHDIELIALTLRLGAAGMVVVTEDRWAEAISTSARQAGGTIIAGEHIPRSRLQAAYAEEPEGDNEVDPEG